MAQLSLCDCGLEIKAVLADSAGHVCHLVGLKKKRCPKLQYNEIITRAECRAVFTRMWWMCCLLGIGMNQFK